MLAASAGDSITGLWFTDQKHFPEQAADWPEKKSAPVFKKLERWLESYFRGEQPALDVSLSPWGTDFQREVWNLLLTIPYGQTTTYGELAQRYADLKGRPSFAARAIGSAVGRNPVTILIPCHRVIGADGSLTGFAGGLARKVALLKLEGILS